MARGSSPGFSPRLRKSYEEKSPKAKLQKRNQTQSSDNFFSKRRDSPRLVDHKETVDHHLCLAVKGTLFPESWLAKFKSHVSCHGPFPHVKISMGTRLDYTSLVPRTNVLSPRHMTRSSLIAFLSRLSH